MKFYEFYDNPKHYYIITEYDLCLSRLITGGEIYKRIKKEKRFSEKITASIMYQLISAVEYIHRNGICHRDIKPENMLINSQENEPITIKMIDFGSAVDIIPNMKFKEKIGTAYYIAPEVLKLQYDEKCDLWSCGVIMYTLICGETPFTAETEEQTLKKVELGTVFYKRTKEY